MPVPVPDSHAVEALIREVSAAEVMPRFISPGESWKKRSGSVVTDADIAAEAFLAAELPTLLPGSVIVGEEMADGDPGVLDRLDGDAPVWVLDPVDGTSNFASGNPDFAVMVGLVARRETVAGWIYRPVDDAMYAAEAGAGAYRNGERLAVSPAPTKFGELEGSLGGFLRRRTDLPERFARVTATQCIGIDYCALADGAIHFAHYRGIWAWDHAPGLLLHAEAGGVGRCLDRSAYRIGLPEEGGLLLAPDEATWEKLRELIAAALASA